MHLRNLPSIRGRELVVTEKDILGIGEIPKELTGEVVRNNEVANTEATGSTATRPETREDTQHRTHGTYKGRIIKRGDWICIPCEELQFARNARCRKC